MNSTVEMSYDKICNKLEELENIVSKLIENQKSTRPISRSKKSDKHEK
jgi:hypothetical protein